MGGYHEPAGISSERDIASGNEDRDGEVCFSRAESFLNPDRENRHFLLDTVLIPAYASIISLVLLPVIAFWKIRKQQNKHRHLKKYGGIVKLGLEWLRVVLSVVLVCLGSARNLSLSLSNLHFVRISPTRRVFWH